jgi:hypothetical protein
MHIDGATLIANPQRYEYALNAYINNAHAHAHIYIYMYVGYSDL